MGNRKRTYSACSETSEHFYDINQKEVEDITLEVFYKPHTITVLSLSLLGLVYLAFTRDDSSVDSNLWKGGLSVVTFFIVISCLAFPNGPFTRPHPLLWRCVFGFSVLYFTALVFVIFQNYGTVRYLVGWICPELKNFTLVLPLYAQDCNRVSLERIQSCMDIYVFGHVVGWILKALLIRHYGLCWVISVTWELTELAFLHLLPNFAECWWDSIILDVIACNGLGIHIGMWICRKMELRSFHWESVKDIQSTTGKIRRAVLQFTPETWTANKWLDPNSSFMRIVGVAILVIMFQLSELNTFFLKHIFEVPTYHRLTMARVILIILVSAPAIRQYYSYVTDTRCTRLGTQAWLYIAINLTELIVCMKFGYELFLKTQVILIITWFASLVLSSSIGVYIFALFVQRHLRSMAKETEEDEALSTLTNSSISPEKLEAYNSFSNTPMQFGDTEVRSRTVRYNLRTYRKVNGLTS